MTRRTQWADEVTIYQLPEHLRTRVLPDQRGCWIWVGYMDRNGYGKDHHQWAHRAVWEATMGPVPVGLEIDHLCRVTRCVNPAHLEPVTRQVNMLRSMHPSAIAVRTGLCKRGHSLDEHGAFRKGGGRYCKECRRQQQRAHYTAQSWPSMQARKRGFRRVSQLRGVT